MQATIAEPEAVWTVRMNRTDSGHAGEKWSLANEGDVIVLRSPDGDEVGRYSAPEAHGAFELPNLGAHKYLGIDLGDVTAKFAPWPKDAKRITAFVQAAPEASSSEALASVRRTAVIQLVIGIILMGIGVLLTVAGTGFIWYGLMVVGFLPIAKSIQGFRNHGRLKGLAAQSV